jgi:hypothetical protein
LNEKKYLKKRKDSFVYDNPTPIRSTIWAKKTHFKGYGPDLCYYETDLSFILLGPKSQATNSLQLGLCPSTPPGARYLLSPSAASLPNHAPKDQSEVTKYPSSTKKKVNTVRVGSSYSNVKRRPASTHVQRLVPSARWQESCLFQLASDDQPASPDRPTRKPVKWSATLFIPSFGVQNRWPRTIQFARRTKLSRDQPATLLALKLLTAWQLAPAAGYDA